MCHHNGFDGEGSEESDNYTPFIHDHDYETMPNACVSGCARTEAVSKCNKCFSKDQKIAELLQIIDKQKQSLTLLEEKLQKVKKEQSFDISDICHSEKFVKIYTGLQNGKLFDWLYNFIMEDADILQYYDQKSNQKKRITRKLSSKQAIFLVLVKLRLGLTDSDLAYRFSISQSTVSVILRTWLPFLSNQFSAFICWP